MRVSVICGGNIGREFLKALLRRQYEIVSVSSPDYIVQDWCSKNTYPCEENLEAFYKSLASQNIDILFSIINPQITPAWVLDLPRLGAFNYHDSLLPKHRGVNAIAWAMWNGDDTLGYTWHKMTAALDAGGILHQTEIHLTGAETCYEANLKVFYKAVTEFDLVLQKLDQLRTGDRTLDSQDLSLSPSMHRKSDLPSEAARLIRQNWTSGELKQKSRALDFGPTKSPFGALLIETAIGLKPCTVEKLVHSQSMLEKDDHVIQLADNMQAVVKILPN